MNSAGSKRKWMLVVLAIVVLAATVPEIRYALFGLWSLIVGTLYLFTSLLIVVSIAGLLLWYLFRIVIPGLIRYRRLRMIRFYRAARRLPDE